MKCHTRKCENRHRSKNTKIHESVKRQPVIGEILSLICLSSCFWSEIKNKRCIQVKETELLSLRHISGKRSDLPYAVERRHLANTVQVSVS